MEAYAQHTGKLFIISGPSGAGKGTICKRLIEDSDPDRMELSVSMTTRPPRKGEVDGVSYYFVTMEQFRENVLADGFLEHAEVYGNCYGTPKAKVIEKLEAGIDVVLEIDIQGAMNVKKAYPDGIFIFILPPSMSILRKRLTGRGTDSMDIIDMRLSKTLGELSYIEEYDYVVVNGELEEAVDRVKAIVVAEHSRVTENINELIERYKEEI
ncbi:guanylate kinase [Hornefia butyriciproducens]|uniref:Guanylate kinase n=2 Tax=Hornefia butyriciproducens TaxID=2652293 RepID=A0A6L5Y574_9FIRM|nr:guanylate kinase [Hornefia butyriciproducens]MCI7327503.1 guanylate kinase [Clostridiales bacterium]HCE77721.1 guanylate kinase [Lachnospiraceae bacterium]MCI7413375.1 guanylate kinase [Clostridiales bacterium]MCI7678786.1 guanylate kinase [Clostridiales bacterium]MDY2991798.1 guanylate kinase [Hornefia butyriciproducens]